ncbi:baseplate J/gp47 family protein [Chitinophaga arvensicola]|uniref:Baseplate J-like protein n=1 Tax=Chitinophaga arvensicola TaxID=29529 RepID=A0A1I0S6U9_9BACT|nr:hypothetical protein [Chitinophaga arvensicola]SEW51388.1 hypothetical protein SAMN04488122_4222 [Chitinophaga arvensicola]
MIVHPFQYEPGISQRNRQLPALDAASAPIDGRKLADLLHYFVQMAPQVNYYQYQGATLISDWQPFFRNSLPFLLAQLAKTNTSQLNDDFEGYVKQVYAHPVKDTIQLLIDFLYYDVIVPVAQWQVSFHGTGLAMERKIEAIIQQKLRTPLSRFIQFTNGAVKHFCVRPLDLSEIKNNDIWNIDPVFSYLEWNESFQYAATSREKALLLLQAYQSVFQPFIDAVAAIAALAPDSIAESLQPLNETYKQQHTPHLGLLFAFLYLFGHTQEQLNGFTQKHLDFFFQRVLGLVPKPLTPDQAHVVFELQQPFPQYLLPKGTSLRDGKDKNKSDVLFQLADEIVVDNAIISSLRTLYVNPLTAFRKKQQNGQTLCYEKDFIEGVYIATQANMADGVSKPFQDGAPKNWFTAGSRYSKFIAPGKTQPVQHPYARLGFMLASPVLLLQEGTRKITVNIDCIIIPETGNCPTSPEGVLLFDNGYLNELQKVLSNTYIFLSDDLIAQAEQMGVNSDSIGTLRDTLSKTEFAGDGARAVLIDGNPDHATQLNIINNLPAAVKVLFKKRKVFQLFFSGEKEWIAPPELAVISIAKTAPGYKLTLVVTLPPEVPAVTFYDKKALNGNYNTTLPVLRVEVDQQIKLDLDEFLDDVGGQDCNRCVLERQQENTATAIALYHFLRDFRISDVTIKVDVCGVKNIIVQNDETVQDVNAPVYPFGTRPSLIDFEILDGKKKFSTLAKGPSFYIGSTEIFGKKWDHVNVNMNWKDKPSNFATYYGGYIQGGLLEADFKVRKYVLQDGKWFESSAGPEALFQPAGDNTCDPGKVYGYSTALAKPADASYKTEFSLTSDKVARYNADTRDYFAKITLSNQDFLHKDYAFVLARQMTAFNRLLDNPKDPKNRIDTAAYYNSVGAPVVFNLKELKQLVDDASTDADSLNKYINDPARGLDSMIPGDGLSPWVWHPPAVDALTIRYISRGPNAPDFPVRHGFFEGFKGLTWLADDVKKKLDSIKTSVTDTDTLSAIIPNEPWTPVISQISLDYSATAIREDVQLLHLYPFEDTFKEEVLELTPPLLPVFCDEGTLFVGLSKLQPYGNLNLLFQLAEATADSESDKATVNWYYLASNSWKPLRKGFEVIKDDTDELTRSGVINIAVPGDINTVNTIMPAGTYWLKAAIGENVQAICETIGVHTQAVLATFSVMPENDVMRLGEVLKAGGITKLADADAHIKTVTQPYDGFNGRLPEADGHFYIRVSEHLRHKGRAIQSFDYERLTLEAFPQLYKAKCVNHTLGLGAIKYQRDCIAAGGYIVVAVIPDLRQLSAGNLMEPKVPLSLLEKIHTYLKQRSSPFVRLKVTNPRYEKVKVDITIKIYKGKDEKYYTDKLKTDLQEFFAPWAIGKLDKLSFGQIVHQADVVRFVEQLDYVDYVICLTMQHELESSPAADMEPHTPRSILVSGDINVSLEKTGDCRDAAIYEAPQETDCNIPEPLIPPCKAIQAPPEEPQGPIIN